jgi:hypothetical protein
MKAETRAAILGTNKRHDARIDLAPDIPTYNAAKSCHARLYSPPIRDSHPEMSSASQAASQSEPAIISGFGKATLDDIVGDYSTVLFYGMYPSSKFLSLIQCMFLSCQVYLYSFFLGLPLHSCVLSLFLYKII